MVVGEGQGMFNVSGREKGRKGRPLFRWHRKPESAASTKVWCFWRWDTAVQKQLRL